MLKSQSLLTILLGAVVLVAPASAQNDGPPPVRSFSDTSRQPFSSTATSNPSKTAPQVQRYATKNRRFTIPFSLVSPEQVIVEVHLFVSADRGRHWQQQLRADIRQNQFEFVAPSDGEYWFAVQTLNRNGLRVPSRVSQPELIVAVDTVPPTIEARSSTDNAGRVIVEWRARDEQLAPDSLSIRHRPSGPTITSPWKDVPAKCTKTANGPLLQDSVAFWPEYNELNLDLEVSIRDQAGNQATVQTSTQRTQTSPQFAMMPTQIGSRANGAKPANSPNQSENASNTSVAGATKSGTARNAGLQIHNPNPNANWVKPDEPKTVPSATANPSEKPALAAVEWHSARHSSSGKFSASGSTQAAAELSPKIQPIAPIDEPQSQSNQIANLNQAPDSTIDGSSKPAMLVADRTESEADREPHSVLSASIPDPNLMGQAISMKSKRFRLNYQVEAIDPAGVKEVAVWTTRDAGKTWSKLGSIPDPHGPYPVEVEGSGLYGFRLVVISHSGLKSRLPQPGDSADKWVRVDIDRPVVKITSAPNGTGDQAGKLVINWEVRDDLLSLRPIEIAYSTRADGPWTTIEKGVRNTGSYAWAVPADTPDRVFLKVTARDEAGNVGTDQTSYAIDVSNLYPRGRIDGVEPVGD